MDGGPWQEYTVHGIARVGQDRKYAAVVVVTIIWNKILSTHCAPV